MNPTGFGRRERMFKIMMHQYQYRQQEINNLTALIKGEIQSIQFFHDYAVVWLRDGRKFRWNPSSFHSLGALMRDGWIENEERKILERIIQPGFHVMDIGANFGWYSTLFSKWVEDSGKVYSFEPLPEVFGELASNMELNGLNNVSAFQMAISNFHGDSTISQPVFLGSEYASLAEIGAGIEETKIRCEVTELDRFVQTEAITELDFVKIDVEGNEYHVLLGAEQTLVKYKPTIMIEIFEEQLYRFNVSVEDIPNYLNDLGYVLYVPRQGKLMEIDISAMEGNRNLICLHSSRKKGIFIDHNAPIICK